MTTSIESIDATTSRLLVNGAESLKFTAAGDLTIRSVNGGQLGGMRNRIINGNFGINQRAVTGTVTLAAGAYGHDRFKAGAGGCTYTFATVQNETTLTITAGTLQQVIEGANLMSGGFVLSWTGTATGRIDVGAYGPSGITGTAVGGTNQTVEFGTGTVSRVMYERGTVATPFEMRPYGLELALCQRYLPAFTGSGNTFFGSALSATQQYVSVNFLTQARVAPTGLTVSSPSHFNVSDYVSQSAPATAIGISTAGTSNAAFIATVAGLTTFRPGNVSSNTAAAILLFTGCEL